MTASAATSVWSGRLAARARRSGGIVQAAYVARLGFQAATFWMLASGLPIGTFGRFATVSAAIVVALPWTFAGAEIVLVRQVARHELCQRSLVRAGRTALLSLGLVATVVGALAFGVAGLGLSVVGPFLVAEIALLPFVAAAGQLSLVCRGKRRFAGLATLPQVVRFGAAGAALTASGKLQMYATCDCLGAVVVAGTVLWWDFVPNVRRALHTSRAAGEFRVREGLSYATGLSARGVYADADKLILTHALGPASTAVYTVAYRILAFAQAPAQAWAAMYFPRLLAADGNAALIRDLFKGLRIRTLASGVLGTGAMLFACGIIIPLLLPTYTAAVPYGYLLAMVAISSSVTAAFADVVTACGGQWRRVSVQLAVAAGNPALTWILVVSLHLSLYGAVVATLVSEGALLLGLGLQVRALLSRRDPPVAS